MQHLTTPLNLSVIGCAVNRPSEAKEADIGLAGGGNGTHPVFLSGVADHRIDDSGLFDHLAALIEQKARKIEARDIGAAPPAAEIRQTKYAH